MRKINVLVISLLLASCAHGGSPLPASWPSEGALSRPFAVVYALLYSFKNGSDAAYPYAGLTDVNGTLYGTTYGGGSTGGWGTVFRVSADGTEKVIYRFKAGNDGAHPYGDLTDVNGMLYGTTYQGGAGGNGTVFKVSTAGVEHVLYSFKAGNDGQYPYCRLLLVNSDLYGTTYTGGGGVGWGVVFKVTTGGQESVVYRFKAGKDGAHPWAGLINVNGMLYGTTYQGGSAGSGTVYKVTTSGKESVLYSFKGGNDGQYPYAPLLSYNGALFGTTYQGGVSTGWGIVYRVSTAGQEKVLYQFKAGNDGAHPQFGRLVALNGELYGTTYQGGTSGAGAVFEVSPAGAEHVIYSFKGGTDGQYPYAGLASLNAMLYSTTYQGGSDGFGTIFKLKP
ncbi:MAG TPA: choice-of-anchor tandem repeat GloVer-containing protein [Candidatus Cybelea sp.]|jgi:uncharacterized repeat protein (TIGR03803 family)|nr:choice-of-anchor tandem repeat GloVer-containing protein [Candidatus Cybelea sp.]